MRRGVWHAFGAVFAALAVAVGCRDLELPNPNQINNPGPTLRFVTPVPSDEAAQVNLVAFVSVEALDADGVGAVELSCDALGAEVPLIRWVAAPYEAQVDLSPCRGADLDASADMMLELTARATDALGNASAEARSVRVRVNLDIAALALRTPQRVSPNRTFDITVTSDRPLFGLPSVRVEGAPVQYLSMALNGDGLPEYRYRAQAPRLGANPDAGPGETRLEDLEEIERFASVTAEGRAGSGNITQVNAQIRVSRILWDRPLPNTFYNEVANGPQNPLAADGGVYVPLEVASRGGALDIVLHQTENGQPVYIPQFLVSDVFELRQSSTAGGVVLVSDGGVPVRVRADGSLALAPGTASEPILLDGGLPVFLPTGTPTTAPLTLTIDPARGAAIHASIALNGKRGPLTSIGALSCEQTVSLSTCPPAGTQRIAVCTGPEGDVTVDGGTAAYTGTGAVLARSGDVVGLFNPGTHCASGVANDVFKLAPLGSSQTGFVNWPGTTFDRVLPQGNGVFYGVYFNPFNGLTQVMEFSLTSGSIITPRSLPSLPNTGVVSSNKVLAARPDRRIVVFNNALLSSVFALWDPAFGKLDAIAELPFVYSLPDSTANLLPYNAEVDDDGSIYVLLRREGADVGRPRLDVVALRPDLQPKWIYHYPRADQDVARAYRLSLDRRTGQLYLVDGDNGFVVALAR